MKECIQLTWKTSMTGKQLNCKGVIKTSIFSQHSFVIPYHAAKRNLTL